MNVLCLGGRVMGIEVAWDHAQTFVASRLQRRRSTPPTPRQGRPPRGTNGLDGLIPGSTTGSSGDRSWRDRPHPYRTRSTSRGSSRFVAELNRQKATGRTRKEVPIHVETSVAGSSVGMPPTIRLILQRFNPISSVTFGRWEWDDHACWSGSPMPRSDRISRLPRHPPPIVADRARPDDRLCSSRRPISRIDSLDGSCRSKSMPVGRRAKLKAKASDRATTDTRVRLAAASQPGQGTEARTENDRSDSATTGTRRPTDVAWIPIGRPRLRSSLPSDSDEATLDAIAASRQAADAPRGDRSGLPLSTSVARPAREHRSGRRAAADRVLDVPADCRGPLRRGGIQPGSGRHTRPSWKAAGIQLPARPRNRAYRPQPRDDLRAGRAQGSMAAPRLRPSAGPLRAGTTGDATSPGSRRSAPTRRWPTRSRSPTTTSSGARPCGGRPRTPSVAPRRSWRMLASASARASSSARSSCGPRCKRPSIRQELHAATEAEFVALAGLNLAIGLKVQRAGPRRRADRRSRPWPPRSPIACRRPSSSAASSTSCSARSRSPCKGAASPGPSSRPRSSRMGPC